MPLELIDDLSRGKSWLSFARGSKALEQAAGSLEYDYDESSEGGELQTEVYAPSGKLSARHPDKKYSGKTYDSVESVDEFFRKRAARLGSGGVLGTSPAASYGFYTLSSHQLGTYYAIDAFPGSYVRPRKHGRGVVLRRMVCA